MVSVGARKTDTKLRPNSHLGGRDRHQSRHRARAVIFREGDLDADSKAYSRDQEDSGGRCLAFHLAQASGQALVWDPRPGIYYLEWWDGGQRLREVAGETLSQVIAAQRRKQIQVAGGTHEEPDAKPQVEE